MINQTNSLKNNKYIIEASTKIVSESIPYIEKCLSDTSVPEWKEYTYLFIHIVVLSGHVNYAIGEIEDILFSYKTHRYRESFISFDLEALVNNSTSYFKSELVASMIGKLYSYDFKNTSIERYISDEDKIIIRIKNKHFEPLSDWGDKSRNYLNKQQPATTKSEMFLNDKYVIKASNEIVCKITPDIKKMIANLSTIESSQHFLLRIDLNMLTEYFHDQWDTRRCKGVEYIFSEQNPKTLSIKNYYTKTLKFKEFFRSYDLFDNTIDIFQCTLRDLIISQLRSCNFENTTISSCSNGKTIKIKVQKQSIPNNYKHEKKVDNYSDNQTEKIPPTKNEKPKFQVVIEDNNHPNPSSKTDSPSTKPNVTASVNNKANNITPNIIIKKSIDWNNGTFCTAVVSKGLQKFLYTIGLYKQALIFDNINEKSCNLEEKAWFSKDNHYRYDITYNKTLKKWMIKFKAFDPCYVMLDKKGNKITSADLNSKYTQITIRNINTQKIEQDFIIMVT